MADLDLLRRLAETNEYPNEQPLPADWSRDRALDAPQRGSDIMSTIHRTRPIQAEPTPPPNRWRLAIAAAVALIVTIGGFLIINSQGDDDVIHEPLPDVQIAQLEAAESAVDAFYTFDEQELRSLLPERVGTPLIFLDQERFATLNARIVERSDCTRRSSSEVLCSTRTADDLTDALGYQSDVSMFVAFNGQEVIGVRLQDAPPEAGLAFYRWLDDNHPNVLANACEGNTNTASDQQACWSAIMAALPEYLSAGERVAIAEGILDAFYTFDEQQLREAIGSDLTDQSVLFNQGDGEHLNLQLVNRQPCVAAGQSQVLCPVTSADDITRAFGFEWSEQLNLVFADDRIISANWQIVAEVPAHYDAFWTWLGETHPSIQDVTCGGWEMDLDDPGRGACWAAILATIPDFKASDAYTGP